MLGEKAANTNINIVFGVTWPRLAPTIYHSGQTCLPLQHQCVLKLIEDEHVSAMNLW